MMQDTLRNNDPGQILNFEIEDYYIDLSPFDQATHGATYPDDLDNPDISSLLKRSHITYSLKVNVANLIKEISRYSMWKRIK